MEHLALARQWRPQRLEEMIGQEVAVRALTYALDHQKLHHAYLFTGTRGVGKTSLARLLAKSLNCEQGISSHPCGQCPACEALVKGNFVDFYEIDAASRTKVEDTRELLENVQYLPVQGRFKIYLIDEVHMLSGHSFNALLKTLEEPPAHVKFLLATTDPHKVPVTVLSRCLQFHLPRISQAVLSNHLTFVLEKENIPFEADALTFLSRAAEGSARDALSLLEQAIQYGQGRLRKREVQDMLGLAQGEELVSLLQTLVDKDGLHLLGEIERLFKAGVDFSNLLSDLLSWFHQIAIFQKVPEALNDYVYEKEVIASLARGFSPENIQTCYEIGLKGQRYLPYTPSPRIGVEMILLHMLSVQIGNGPQKTKDINTDINKVNKKLEPESIKASTDNVRKTETQAKMIDEMEIARKEAKEKKKRFPQEEEKIQSEKKEGTKSSESTEEKIATDWVAILSEIKWRGRQAEIMKVAELKKGSFDRVQLKVPKNFMITKTQETILSEMVSKHMGRTVSLVFEEPI